MRAARYTNQDIIDAYRRTGSVWRAGKELGVTGQTVHERLRAIGYPLSKQNWSDGEVEELKALLGHVTLSEIARRLGRPYAGVACKASELAIPGQRPREVKVPRGAGYDKASVSRYIKQLDQSGEPITRFARRAGLGVEALCQAVERYFPNWWQTYRTSHSDLAERRCIYCNESFIPSNSKQKLCSRACGSARRRDESYFGGKRRQTVGLTAGQCQLCGRSNVKGLSSHHVLGKENDPQNDVLIALCPGCHKAVTLLATRNFIDDPAVWEALIQLVWFRRHGGDDMHGVYTYVELEPLSADDTAEATA